MGEPAPDVARLQLIAAALVAGFAACAVAAVSLAPRVEAPLGRLVAPVALLGAVAPVVAARLHERTVRGASTTDEPPRVVVRTAMLLAFGVGQAAAYLGLVGWVLTREPLCWIGPLTFVLVAGAFWPGEARVDGVERRIGEARGVADD